MSDIDVSQLDMQEVQRLLEDLKTQEEALREKARTDLIAKWSEEAAKAGFESVEEVLGIRRRRRAASRKLPPKYRNPENPKQTWTGRGKAPKWIRAHEDKHGGREGLEIR